MAKAALVFEQEVEHRCVMNDQDICMRCLDKAQEVPMLLIGDHYECSVCKWHCKCWK